MTKAQNETTLEQRIDAIVVPASVPTIEQETVNNFRNTFEYKEQEKLYIEVVDATKIINNAIPKMTQKLFSNVLGSGWNERGIIIEITDTLIDARMNGKKGIIIAKKLFSLVQHNDIIVNNKWDKTDTKYLSQVENTVKNTIKAINKIIDKNSVDTFGLNFFPQIKPNTLFAQVYNKVNEIVTSFGWNSDFTKLDTKATTPEIQIFNNAIKELSSLVKQSESLAGTKTPEQQAIFQEIEHKKEILGRIINEALEKQFVNENHIVSLDIASKFASLTNDRIKEEKQAQKEEIARIEQAKIQALHNTIQNQKAMIASLTPSTQAPVILSQVA